MRKSWPLIVVVLLATVSRLLCYDAWSFSNDELSALSRLDYDSLGLLISKGVATDGHPALVQVFLYYWTAVFGTSETAVRMPFIVAGILAVALTYLLANRWFGRSTAIISSLSMALLEFPVLYSQLARPYSVGLLFVMTAVFLWDTLLFRTKTNKWLIATMAGIAYALAMYTHYFSFLAVLIAGITGLFFVDRNTRLAYLYSGILAVLLFVPHIPVTIHHITVGGVGGWLAKPEPWWLLTHLKYVFNDSWWLLAIALITGAYSLLHQLRSEGWKRFQSISLVFFGMLFLTGFFYSIFVNAVIQHSTMLFGLPFLLMFIFSGFSHLKKQNLAYLLAAMLLIFPPLGIWGFYSQQHFGEFKDIAAKFVEWNKLTGKNNTTNILYTNSQQYIDFYFKEDSVSFDFVFYNQPGELDSLATSPAFGDSEYAVFAWTKPYRTQVYDIIRSRYPFVVHDKNYGNLSRITLFSKKSGKKYDTVFRPDKILLKKIVLDFDETEFPVDIDTNNLAVVENEPCYRASKEYNLTYRTTLSAIRQPITEVEITGKLFSTNTLEKASITFSMGPGKGKRKVWRNIPLSHFQTDSGGWNRFVFTPEIEATMDDKDRLTLFFWNPQKETFFIDNLSIKLYGE